MITIITPTYNRAYIIDKAYKSLLSQTNKNFEWIVVDDGSYDNTKDLINNYIKENKITIKYFYQKNSGKHIALNTGIEYAEGELLIILDSDDILTDNAIERIYFYHNKYKNNKKICGYSFLKLFPDCKPIESSLKENEIISNHISFRYNQNHPGDMEEVFKTNILKKYPFPKFKNERFLSETIVWNKIAFDYDTVYINEGIYIADYINDGLSKNFLKVVYNNPIGASENANMFLNKNFKLIIRIKNAILYDGYSLISKKKIRLIINDSNSKILSLFLLPFGYLFKFFLQTKKN